MATHTLHDHTCPAWGRACCALGHGAARPPPLWPGLLPILVGAVALFWPAWATAAPISLLPGTVNMLRDTRGANNVGIGQGDLFQYGADVSGGSAGTLLSAATGRRLAPPAPQPVPRWP